MLKKLLSATLAAVMIAGLATPVAALFRTGFTEYGGYTPTKMSYTFLTETPDPVEEEEETEPTNETEATTEETNPTDPVPPPPGVGPAMVYNKEVNLAPNLQDILLAGSDLYIPIGVQNTGETGSGTVIATDKDIKTDNVQISHKVITGADFVDAVTLISGKKEKLNDLPAGMYAKIELADTFLPLDHSQLTIRLVLSVNGVSYQRTAVTINCYLRNRIEGINRNSVYGAMHPMQFRVDSRYYGDATFDFGGDIKYTARVSPSKKYYLNLDRSVKDNIKEMYPQAYLEYYDFKGHNDTFASTGKLEIPVNKSKFKEKKTSTQLYVYEIVGDKLTSLDRSVVTYNHTTNRVTIHAMTLGSYIFSSRPLMRSVDDSKEWDILRSGYAEETDVDEPFDAKA